MHTTHVMVFLAHPVLLLLFCSRMGDWERKPLTREQQRYAAMDAYACLLLHWELQNLPTKQTLQQRLIDAMRERAAGEDDSDDDEQ